MTLAPRISRAVPRSIRQERPGDSKLHLAMIRQLPCCRPGCGSRVSDPHHLQRAVDGLPKGASLTHADRWAIPVCRAHHTGGPGSGNDFIHWRGNDEAVLLSWGIDGKALAQALWSNTGDHDACLRIVERAKAGAMLKERT